MGWRCGRDRPVYTALLLALTVTAVVLVGTQSAAPRVVLDESMEQAMQHAVATRQAAAAARRELEQLAVQSVDRYIARQWLRILPRCWKLLS
jgi:ABC-type protease/lipase transport system fused ATPase/permease subunit